MSLAGSLNNDSVLLIALGLTATWLVLFYSFTRNAQYEEEVSQMNRVQSQLKRMFAERRDPPSSAHAVAPLFRSRNETCRKS